MRAALRALTIRDYVQYDYPHTAPALAESMRERYPSDAGVLVGKAVSLLTGIGGVGATNGNMGIVDGGSGVLEALASALDQGSGSKKLEEDPEGQMARIAELITAKLPEADPAARVEQSGDEDVLADVEALLEE